MSKRSSVNKEDRGVAGRCELKAPAAIAILTIGRWMAKRVRSAYWGVYFAMTDAIRVRCDQEGIGIPYPLRDVPL